MWGFSAFLSIFTAGLKKTSQLLLLFKHFHLSAPDQQEEDCRQLFSWLNGASGCPL